MKFIHFSLILVCAWIFSMCSSDKPQATSLEKKDNIPYALRPENIYRYDSIEAALKNASTLQKAESRKLFMTGLDLLANKNDAAASIEYFKEAIFYYPDEKNYIHLFKAYFKNNQLDLADSVNDALAYRTDMDEVSYNDALIAAVRKDTAACIDGLYEAIRMGFAFGDRIKGEKLFGFLKENPSFQSLLVTYFGDDETIRRTLFKAFMKNLPQLELPYQISSDSAANFNFDHYIDYDFALFVPGMENSRFSRDVSNEYMYVGKFRTSSGHALIYKSYQVIADTLNPVSVNLIVYDSLGKVSSQKEIACFCSPLESKGFKIWQDLSLEVSSYKTNWQFDPLEKGYAGNKVLSKQQNEHHTFKITEDNLIKETQAEGLVSNQ